MLTSLRCRNCDGCRREKPYLSAYDIAVKHGYKGSEKDWVESLQSVYLAHVVNEYPDTWDCDHTFEELYALSDQVEVHLVTVAGRTAFPAGKSDTLLTYRTPSYESGVDTVYELYQLTPTGSRRYIIDVDDMDAGSIQRSWLDSDIQTSLDKADSAYQLPEDGVPMEDLDPAVQAKIEQSDTALQPTDAPVYVTLEQVGGVVRTDKSWEEIAAAVGSQRKVTFTYQQLVMHLNGVNWGTNTISLFGEIAGTVLNAVLTADGDVMTGSAEGLTIYVKPNTGIPLTDLEQAVQDKVQKSGFKSIAFVESSGTYTFLTADFAFENVDDLISQITRGANVRIVIYNTSDTYPAVHFQGTQSLARLYFAGTTVTTSPNYGVAIDAFELKDSGQSVSLTRVYHEAL